MVLLRRLALAAALLQPADAAERVKFDFNWCFFLGEPDGPGDGSCNATAFHSTGNAICRQRRPAAHRQRSPRGNVATRSLHCPVLAQESGQEPG